MAAKDEDLKAKTSAGKVPIWLVPIRALFGAARVFAYGIKKYAKGNYVKCPANVAVERYGGATIRHLTEMQNERFIDDESGLPHLDHAICSLVMLREILVVNDVMPADPGEGKDPPTLGMLAVEAAKWSLQCPGRTTKYDPNNERICQHCGWNGLHHTWIRNVDEP